MILTDADEIEHFARYNTTELYQAAYEARLRPDPRAPRETLIALLRGTAVPAAEEQYTDALRLALAGWIDEYWSTLRSMISCPAKAHHPRTCFVCPDAQVLQCLQDNPHATQYVELRVPPRGTTLEAVK